MGNNEMFSQYTELEKRELIEYIKNYKLELLETIGIDQEIKFGIELEIESPEIYKLITEPKYRKEKLIDEIMLFNEDYFKKFHTTTYDYQNGPWILKKDITVKQGGEVHSPILTDTLQTWGELKKICELLTTLNSHVTENTATHIHFDEETVLNDKYDLYNLIKLYSAYENVLYSFGTGEFVNFRSQINRYASPMAKDTKNKLKNIILSRLTYEELLEKMDFTYYRGMKLTNLKIRNPNKLTIEFRFSNGSLTPAVIQNLINAEAKMCEYAKSDNFDDDLVTRRFKNLILPTTNIEILDSYLTTTLDDILEFADLIFSNTLDKLNFIRQCIKEPDIKTEGLQKAKKFYNWTRTQ